ncbi:MAG: hypothetical protein HC836_23120 [Richelia sp. RM2_1_2]|nr:hypothetical protein [Richelia sp. RM2_1_2]
MKNYTSFIHLLEGYIPPKDHKPFLYEVGQKVRISKKVTENERISNIWAGSVAQILSRRHANVGGHYHIYKVKLLHGTEIFEFSEADFDRRFIRKNLDKNVA